MNVTGWEDWEPDEIASRLSGDDIPPGDIEGLHGAVIVLCRRVAELQQKVANGGIELPRVRRESGVGFEED